MSKYLGVINKLLSGSYISPFSKKNISLPIDEIVIEKSIENLSFKFAKKLLNKKRKSRAIILKICDIIEDAGGIDYAKKKLDEYSDLARNSISSYPNSDIKKSLLGLVEFNISRVK